MAIDDVEDNPLAPLVDLFTSTEEPDPNDPSAMSLMDHLEELRRRIFKILIAVVLFAVVAFIFRNQIMNFLTWPLPSQADALAKSGQKLVVSGIGEGFTTFLLLSVAVGFVGALPVTLYQVWAFVAPGLYAHEKKHAVPFIIAGLVLFLAGLSLGYIVLQYPMQWLINFGSESFTELITVSSYFTFVAYFLLAFGVVFEIPLVLTFLSLIGMITADMLSKKRAICHVGMWAAATVITPGADLYSPIFLGVAMSFLFELSIIFIRIAQKMRKKDEEEEVA